jgi:hypothetical protein
MQDINNLMREQSLFMGRMISGGKQSPKGCRCVWNANLVSPTQGKVWYGDLNLTREGDKLKMVSIAAGETLYVLREMDCRFEHENDPIEVLIENAVWNTNLPVPRD